MASPMQQPSAHGFYRGTDRIIGGVCSGLAEGFHVEVLWVRLAFVLLAFLQGIGLVLYVVLWVLMPDRTGGRVAGRNSFESMTADIKRAWAELRTTLGFSSQATATASPTVEPAASTAGVPSGSASSEVAPSAPPATAPPQAAPRNPSFILGAILIAVGIAFLAANTNIPYWSVIWPAGLVAIGVLLLVRNFERRS
jgi:phage shock protein PspC (stress-responsive transcriptional regulator)